MTNPKTQPVTALTNAYEAERIMIFSSNLNHHAYKKSSKEYLANKANWAGLSDGLCVWERHR